MIVSGTCTPAATSNAVTVTVNTAPAITVEPTAPAAVCSGSGTQTMTVTATGTGITYQWRKGGVPDQTVEQSAGREQYPDLDQPNNSRCREL